MCYASNSGCEGFTNHLQPPWKLHGHTEGYCYAAGMAQLEDGAFYAAAPQEAEVPERTHGQTRWKYSGYGGNR